MLQRKDVKATFLQGFLNKQHGNNIQPDNTAELQYTIYVPEVAASIFASVETSGPNGKNGQHASKMKQSIKKFGCPFEKSGGIDIYVYKNQLRPQTGFNVLLFNSSKANCDLLKYQDEPFSGTELNRERLEGDIKGVICQKHNDVFTLSHQLYVCPHDIFCGSL